MLICLNFILSYLGTSAQAIYHDCPYYGDNPHYYAADSLKNRYEIPTHYTRISFEKMATMKHDDNADERRAVKLKGYVITVKYGGSETCNCHSKDKNDYDVHIVLSNSENNLDEKDGIVVELTPRLRNELNNGWDKNTVKKLFYHQWVTVSGYLFNDKQHKGMSAADDAAPANTHRASCWEIHPVTYIELTE